MAISEELVNFVKQQRESGVPDEAIKQALLQEGGWNQEDLEQVFGAVEDQITQPPDDSFSQRSTDQEPKDSSQIDQMGGDTHNTKSAPDVSSDQQGGERMATSSDEKRHPSQLEKKSSSWGKVIIASIGLLFVAGGAFAGYAFLKWDEWTMTDAEIIAAGFSNLSDVSSYSFEGGMKIDAEEGSNNAQITIDITGGGTTLSSEEEPKAWTDLEFGFSTKQGAIEANVTTPIKVRIVNEKAYLYIDEVPEDFGPIPFPEKQWVLIDLSDMSKITQATQNVTRSSIDPVDQEMYRELITGAFDVAKETKLYTLDRTNSFFDNTYVFEINIHPTQFKEFSAQFAQRMAENENLTREVREVVQILNENFQETEDNVFEEAEQNMQEHLSIGLQVRKDDLYLTNFKLSFDDVPDELVGEEFQALFSFDMHFFGFNEPVSVEVPENARPLEEILPRSSRSTTNPFLERSREEGRKAEIKSSMTSIRSEAEILISDDHMYPEDMFTNESYGMADTIKRIENNASYPLIYGLSSDGREYAVSIQLDEQEYFCVDSEGAFITSNVQMVDPESGDLSCGE